MRGLITAEKIRVLVEEYVDEKSVLVKSSDILRGKEIKFTIYPVLLGEIRRLLKKSDESEDFEIKILSEKEVRVLKKHPYCTNAEHIELFCKEVCEKGREKHRGYPFLRS